MPTFERSLTAMLRDSGSVLRAAERQDVLIRRRDGADMMLVEFKRERGVRDSARQLAAFVVLLITEGEVGDQVMNHVIVRAIPWTQYLSPEDRLLFLQELATVSQASADLENWDPVRVVLDSWMNTARLYAIPKLQEAASSKVATQGDEAVTEVLDPPSISGVGGEGEADLLERVLGTEMGDDESTVADPLESLSSTEIGGADEDTLST